MPIHGVLTMKSSYFTNVFKKMFLKLKPGKGL